QVTQMPSVPAEAVLTLELGGRVLAESRAHCQQGHARFQERMALQIQGGGSEGQSCMLRVSAKGTRSSPPNCPEEFSAEVAFTTKDIMRRVHSKHGQQYFHYRMLPKDSSASASLDAQGHGARERQSFAGHKPGLALIADSGIDVLDGGVAAAKAQLAAELGLALERLDLVVRDQEEHVVVLKNEDALPSTASTIQVCILPDPLQDKLPELLGYSWPEMETLKELDLQENCLEFLPDAFGEKLPRLRKLRLSQNQLQLLPRSMGKLQKLQALQVEGNLLTRLPDFSKSLVDLQLEENRLEALPQSFGSLEALQRLSLDFNRLRFLPESFGSLRSLQKLRLVQNQLEALPWSFGQLGALKDLWLSGNLLEQLPGSWGGLSQLKQLRLGRNRLEELPEAFGHCQNLKILALEENLLTCLPSSFQNLTSLEVLNLDSNKLLEFPSCLCLPRLEKLWLGHNDLQRIPEQGFDQMEALKELSLKCNKLQELPQSLGSLAALEVLYLQDNHLESLPTSLDALTQLRMLWLE
ncbi:unnamed protein product, partial [Effrenium voratum]